MKVCKFSISILLLSIIASFSYAAGPYVEGEHYTRLADKVRTVNPKKIEVVEVFSYDCPHCLAFEPLIQPWKKQLPDSVVFVPMQALWDSYRDKLARTLLTARALKVEDQVHRAVYNAVQPPGQRGRVINDDQIKGIFKANGIDEAKFDKTFNSFGINSQINQTRAKINGYKINSTPQLIVNGEYVISPTRDIDHQAMLDIADYLINKVRAESGIE